VLIMGRLDGKVAIVTGGAQGLGRADCEALVAEGARVLVTDINTEAGEALARELNARRKGCAKFLRHDVTDEAQWVAAIDAAVETFGGLHVLVNNAGITRDGLAMRMKDEDWEAVLATNLSAVFRLSRGVLRGMMKARHGRIINITSVVGESGNAGQANYAAAKAGVAGLTRALAREIGSRGITVNCVAPGFIDTDMTRALGEAQTQALLAQIPLARLGGAEEVAAAVVFLASPAGAYVSGSTLHVNGGMYMA